MTANMLIWSVTPFLLLAGSVIGLRRRPHWSRVISLLGVLILVINVVVGWFANRSLVPSPEGRSGLLTAATIQMFATTAGYLIFAIGYVLSNLVSTLKE